MKIFSSEERNFDGLVEAIGFFFQIRDDLANLCSKEYADSKSYCEDLTEGKFSYPIIHAMNSSSVNGDTKGKRLLEILKKRTNDVEVKKEAIALLIESKSFEFTIEKLHEIKKKYLII